MGCCQSNNASPYEAAPRPAQPGSPAALAAIPHDSSRAAINQPTARSISTAESPRASSVAPQQTGRPNVPIRPPTPIATSPAHIVHQQPPWTRIQIEREREAFFDTRVTGRREVWDGLKVVCELLRQGNVVEAQAILDATSVTCPNGRVTQGRGRDRAKGGVYDERGVLYEIPAWVLTDPKDLVEDSVEKDVEAGADADGSEDEEEEEDLAATQRRREEKGKGRQEDLGEIVGVRARLSDRGTDIVISIGTKQKVAVIVRRIQDQIGPRRLRLVYLGKPLNENKTLEEQGWTLGNVLNALVFEGDESMLTGKKGTSR